MSIQKTNLNTVDKNSLVDLKGIGESTATKIIEERNLNGEFSSLNNFYNRLLPTVNRGILDKFIDRFEISSDDNNPDIIDAIIELSEARSAGKDFCGYVLVIDYIELVSENGETSSVFRQVVIQFNNTNKLIWKYYPSINTVNGYVLKLKSPSGNWVKFKLSDSNGTEFEYKLMIDGLNFKSKILIEILAESLTDIADSERASILPRYATGRLLEFHNQRTLEDIQIIFYGSKEDGENAPYHPILSTTTEKNGYFSISYPTDSFNSVYAIIGIIGTESIPVTLEEIDGQLMFPQNLILVASVPELTESDKCDCEDLEFHRPRRVLEEFSYFTVVRTTEPEIKVKQLDEPTVSLGDIRTRFPLAKATIDRTIEIELRSSIVEKRNGGELNRNVIMMRSANSDAQEEELNLDDIKVPISVFKKITGSTKTITSESIRDIIEWHTKYRVKEFENHIQPEPQGRSQLSCDNSIQWDENPEIYQACTIAHGHLLHYKQEWIADGYGIGDLIYSLPLAPGQIKNIVVFDWDRRESASRSEFSRYDEGLYNSLSRDRDLSEISKGVLKEKIKGGSLGATFGTSSGAGAAGIVSGIAGVIGGAIGLGIGGSIAKQSATRRASASSIQRLRDRTIQSASSVRNQRSTVIQTANQGERFEVQSEVIANNNHCHAMTMQYFEVLRHFKVGTRLVDVQECLFIPLEISEFNLAKTLRWREILLDSLIDNQLNEAFSAIDRISSNYKFSDFPDGSFADEDIEFIEGELFIKFQISMPQDDINELGEAIFNRNNWLPIVGLLGYFNPLNFYNSYLKNRTNKERIFQKELAPRIAEAYVESLKFYIGDSEELPFNATLISRYRNNRPLRVSLRQSGQLSGTTRRELDAKTFKLEGNASELTEHSKVIITSAHLKYSTTHINDFLLKDRAINQDIADSVNIMIPNATNRELENPKERDKLLKNKLLSHLNYNLEYYHHAIWLNMDPDRRFMILDGIIAPCKAEGRSVASVVENNLIGLVGNCWLMPVVPGTHLDPTFDISENQNGPQVTLLDHYMIEPPEPTQISIPTKGVFAEAVMGKCNSCETIEEQRFWRWNEVPNPNRPTEINPIDAGTRRAEIPDLSPTDYPSPIINIQNAPAIPDPTGLAKIVDLLSTNEAFRDLTGLEQNQLNALAALQSTLESANKFGSDAANLHKAGADNRKLDKALSQINTSNLSDADKKELTKEAFERYLGGSPDVKNKSKTGSEEKSKQKKETSNQVDNVINAIADVPNGVKVESEETYADGTKSSIALEKFKSNITNKTKLESKGVKRRLNDKSKVGQVVLEGDSLYGSILLYDFDVNGVDLKSNHVGILNQVLNALQNDGSLNITVYGRASQTGSESNNFELSHLRAQNVVDYLTVNNSVDPSRIENWEALGSGLPITDKPGIEKALNRSAEVTFISAFDSTSIKKTTKTKPNWKRHEWAMRTRVSFDVNLPSQLVTVGTKIMIVEIKELSSDAQNIENPSNPSKEFVFVGLQVPLGFGSAVSASTDPWSGWKRFSTGFDVSFEAFDRQYATVSTAGWSLGISSSLAYFSWPFLKTGLIDISGYSLATPSVGFGGAHGGTFKKPI